MFVCLVVFLLSFGLQNCTKPIIISSFILNNQHERHAAAGLQIFSQPLDLLTDKVHVLLLHIVVHHHHAEEVDKSSVRLVATQHGALLRHTLLDGWGNLGEFLPPLGCLLLAPHAGGDVVEAHVGALGLSYPIL